MTDTVCNTYWLLSEYMITFNQKPWLHIADQVKTINNLLTVSAPNAEAKSLIETVDMREKTGQK